MAEFAITVGVLLPLLVGIMAFSQAMSAYHFVASAARQASRYAIVRGASCTGWAASCPASAGDIQTYVRSITPPGIDSNNLTVTTTWLPDNSPGSNVKVTVDYNFNLDIPLVPAQVMKLESTSQLPISQ